MDDCIIVLTSYSISVATMSLPLAMRCGQAPDQEVSVLAMAVLANILSYSDTLLLTDAASLETLGTPVRLGFTLLQ